MARVYTDGAEMGDIDLFAGIGSYNHTINTPGPYSEYSYQIGWGNGGLISWIFPASYYEFYLRMRYYNSQSYMLFMDSGFSTVVDSIDQDEAGHLCTYRGNRATLLTDSGSSAWYGKWSLLEIHLKTDTSSGIFEVKVDGELICDYDGNTNAGPIGGIQFWIKNGYNYCGIDDIALNDTTGGVDDSWPGDGIITKVYPNGNGATSDWTGNDADKVNNYLQVDDFPRDNDTTYVYASGGASGSQDQYALSDYSGAGKTILRIFPEARVRKTQADESKIKLGILASGGSDDMSAARTLTTNYSRVVGKEYRVNPVDSGAWEEADIDALEGIIEVN